ncbi:8047_t:CDS:2, partial [Racocetra persica]
IKKNKRIQNDLNYLHEEKEHIQISINQIVPLTKQLNNVNNKLMVQITCERKSRADLNAKQLKEIESLKFKINLLENSLSLLEQIAQKALLKDTDTTQSLHEIRISLKLDPLSNDLRIGGDAIEEVSGFSKTSSFSLHHSELNLDKCNVKE